VYGEIIVELKAVSSLTNDHEVRLLNYMRLALHPVGYLINFASISAVNWERFVLSEFAIRGMKFQCCWCR